MTLMFPFLYLKGHRGFMFYEPEFLYKNKIRVGTLKYLSTLYMTQPINALSTSTVLGSFQLSHQEGKQQHCPLPQGGVAARNGPHQEPHATFSRKCHISEKEKLRSRSCLIHTHIAGIRRS